MTITQEEDYEMAIITLKCNWYLHELGDRQKLLQYFQEIKGKSIEWELLERPVQMTIDYSFEIVQHREEVIREETLNAYIDLFPDNELARDTLRILQKHKHQDATYKATLYLTGEIGASISIQKNTIILDSQKEYQSELEEIIDKADLTEYLDDDFICKYENKVERFVILLFFQTRGHGKRCEVNSRLCLTIKRSAKKTILSFIILIDYLKEEI